ncbi:hypothetical protein Scep_001273 [Stephania cephalantha]|uniref:Uncharacterized protein n=1 Tax=Stephania cephalantha TaxID=152367 RepID=A0AAP0L941_9MAGN
MERAKEAKTWVEVINRRRRRVINGERDTYPRRESGEGNWYFSAERYNIAVERARCRCLNITEYTLNECFKLSEDESFIPWCADMFKYFMRNPEREERRLLGSYSEGKGMKEWNKLREALATSCRARGMDDKNKGLQPGAPVDGVQASKNREGRSARNGDGERYDRAPLTKKIAQRHHGQGE